MVTIKKLHVAMHDGHQHSTKLTHDSQRASIMQRNCLTAF